MQNLSPATDRCNPRWYFKFPTDFNEPYTKIIVVSSLFYFQPQHPMTRNRPISECTSEMVHAGLRLARLPVKIADNIMDMDQILCWTYRQDASEALWVVYSGWNNWTGENNETGDRDTGEVE